MERPSRNAIYMRGLRGDSAPISDGPNQILRAALGRACSLTRADGRGEGMSAAARRSARLAIGDFARACRARGIPPETVLIDFKRMIAELSPDLGGEPIFRDYHELRALTDDMIGWCIEEYFAEF